MAVLVKCNREGTIVLVAIPHEDYDCESGAIVGPPEFIDMGLSIDQEMELRERLIDLKLLKAPDLLGKRGVLKSLFKELGIPTSNINSLIHSYQTEYYQGENIDGTE